MRTLIPSWAGLSRLGQSKVVRSSWLWTVSVPVAARILHNVPDTIEIPIADIYVPLSLQLPFSWVALFFASLFFSLGAAGYAMASPTLVRKFKDYTDYISTGRHIRELGRYAIGIKQAAQFKKAP